MEPWGQGRPPLRSWDIGPAVVLFAAVCGLGWAVGHFGLRFDLLVTGRGPGSARYLPWAYAVAWLGISASLSMVGKWMVEAILRRRSPWPFAILAIPLIVESWLVGFAVALAVTSY